MILLESEFTQPSNITNDSDLQRLQASNKNARRCGFAFRCLLIHHPHTINANVCSYGAITTKISTRESRWPRSARKPPRFVKKKWRVIKERMMLFAAVAFWAQSIAFCEVKFMRDLNAWTATFYDTKNLCTRTAVDRNSSQTIRGGKWKGS